MSNPSKNIKDVHAAGAESNSHVDALIAEANLVGKASVPAQGSEVTDQSDEKTGEKETPDLAVVEGDKKSLKERLAAVTEQVKKNKKAVAATVAVVGVATLAVVKYVKKQAEQIVVEEPTDDENADETTDESAA
jgi:hypothetical protein